MHITGPHHLSLVTVHWGHLPPNQSDARSHLWAFKEPLSIFFMVRVLTFGFLLPMSLPLWHPHSYILCPQTALCPLCNQLPVTWPYRVTAILQLFCTSKVCILSDSKVFRTFLYVLFCSAVSCTCTYVYTHTHTSLKLCLWLSQWLLWNTCYVSAWFL